MSFERDLSAVPPVQFTADGGQFGLITVSSTSGFFVKSIACIQAPTLPIVKYEIKKILSSTQMLVGPPGSKMNQFADLSVYTVAAGSFVYADEQPKAKIPNEERLLGSYVQEPVNAWRTTLVDKDGNPYDAEHPYPIKFDGTISVGDVQVQGSNGNTLEPNSDGSINAVIADSVAVGTIHQYQEATAVAPNATATIISYSAAINYKTYLQKVAVSGENIAKFQVLVNGSPIETQRTYWGNFNTTFNFMIDTSSGGYLLNAGDLITVTALNYSPSQSSADFEARIQLVTIPIS